MASLISKSRRPKFELHLKIYDLNNVPLVSGVSSVKWHLPHSIRGEHRGRTHKRPIANHRVEYNYAKIVPLRLVIDRNNRLADYPIEFEITQEFESHGASRDEKVVLGKITLNLAEYVADSEILLRDARPPTSDSRPSSFDMNARDSFSGGWPVHARKRSSISTKGTFSSLGTSPGTADSPAAASLGTSGPGGGGGGGGSAAGGPASTAGSSAGSIETAGAPPVEDGVIRRYLMQDSKINSTLKISILMVQVDGERNFIAPPLKSAPVFGGITGVMAHGDVMSAASEASVAGDPDEYSVCGMVNAVLSNATRGHEVAEIQDVYRRTLAASWSCQPGELPADECIEDIFRGGDGFRTPHVTEAAAAPTADSSAPAAAGGGSGGAPSGGKSSGIRLPLPAGTSLGAVRDLPRWSPSSPTRSSIHEEGDEDDGTPAPPSRTSSGGLGGKMHVGRILPKLGPIRRKTLPPDARSSGTSLSQKSVKERDHGANNSSGEDGSSSTRGSIGGGRGGNANGNGSGHSSGNNATPDDEHDEAGGHGQATLRPRDIRKLWGGGQPSSASSASLSGLSGLSGLANLRIGSREDSGLSDRTVTRSSRSSPGPQAASFGHRRDESGDTSTGTVTAGAARSGAGGRPGSSSSRQQHQQHQQQQQGGGRRGRSGRKNSPTNANAANDQGSGSGNDEPADVLPEEREVHEHEVRDDFVAWQLPGSSIAASS